MSVKVSGVVPVRKMLNDLEKFLASPKPMENITEGAIEIIKDKTAKGLNYAHRKFEPYSKTYAKKKGGSKVNLMVTGKMLGDITNKVINPHHGMIFVKGDSAVIAAVHNQGIGKMPQREFFEINKSNRAELTKKHYDDPIMKILKRR